MIVTSETNFETKKMVLGIKDLIKMINDEETKRKEISHEFTLGGVRLSIGVLPVIPDQINHINVCIR